MDASAEAGALPEHEHAEVRAGVQSTAGASGAAHGADVRQTFERRAHEHGLAQALRAPPGSLVAKIQGHDDVEQLPEDKGSIRPVLRGAQGLVTSLEEQRHVHDVVAILLAHDADRMAHEQRAMQAVHARLVVRALGAREQAASDGRALGREARGDRAGGGVAQRLIRKDVAAHQQLERGAPEVLVPSVHGQPGSAAHRARAVREPDHEARERRGAEFLDGLRLPGECVVDLRTDASLDVVHPLQQRGHGAGRDPRAAHRRRPHNREGVASAGDDGLLDCRRIHHEAQTAARGFPDGGHTVGGKLHELVPGGRVVRRGGHQGCHEGAALGAHRGLLRRAVFAAGQQQDMVHERTAEALGRAPFLRGGRLALGLRLGSALIQEACYVHQQRGGLGSRGAGVRVRDDAVRLLGQSGKHQPGVLAVEVLELRQGVRLGHFPCDVLL
mmetsp:Transcript_27402/g.79444  ORF Transcript_27402/g.79444 Transcript_27402/m.79444 type:complete len:443 (+) Transcript_27402:1802-3130(+)